MAASTTPLDESLEKFLSGSGTAPLSQNQVTYGSTVPDIGYDPSSQFRPQGDILTINAEPGSGATTSETWAHELDVERQKQDALEFEFQQQQEADRLAQEAAELAMAQADAAREASAESRAAGMYGYETESAKLANQAASTANQLSSYELLNAQRAEDRYQGSLNTIAANNEMNRWLNGAALSPTTQAAYASYAPAPQANWGTFEYNTNRGGNTYQPGVSTYSPPLGINGKPTQQIYNR